MPRNTLSTQEAREQLYEIVRRDAPFEERAQAALNVGERYLDADNAHLTRIDTETDHWEALVSTDSADGEFPPGLELDLGQTYCRRTLATKSPIALHDALNQGWADDPAFDVHGLHCYHGSTLVVDGEPYGTVCFVATDPRGRPFSDEETMFAELVTRLLERELKQDHYEAELTRQANLVNVLNRVLRHNLRNDMCVVRGRIQYVSDQLDDDSHCEKALQKIDKLVDLSEKARELEKIVGKASERQHTDIVDVVEGVVENLQVAFPDASITVESGGPITAAVLPSFRRALEELVENAAKHAGDSPRVTVKVQNVPNAVEIRISDDGPGLAEPERKVLETGVETPLVHGSGLGLWLVHWIASSHDGSVEAVVDEDGTTMILSIPRMPETDAHEQVAKLKQVRDRYQAAFEDAFDAMVLIDDRAQIVDANAAASEIYGLERQDLLGHSIPTFLPTHFDFQAEREAFQQAGEERDTVTLIGGDGVSREVEYSVTTDVVPGHHLLVIRELAEEARADASIR